MTAVAVVQLKSSEDKQENLRRSVDYVAEASAKKASIVCFPEFQMAFSPDSQSPAELSKMAEIVRGNFVTALRAAARKSRIGVVATIYEKGMNNRVFDTAVAASERKVSAD